MPDLSAAEFTLLQGAHLFAPEDRGICDVLLANGKIIAVGADIPGDIVPDCAVINLSGRMLCPGFIDQHVHLIGGGGEAGPTTRTPEVSLSRLTEAGITTVVGLLGTDSVSRHPASLLAKTRALNEEGITRLDAHGRLSRSVADHYWLGRKRRRADRPRHWREMRSLRPPFRRAQRESTRQHGR
ncbi:isoaspartyl dipeptidase [Salmonella enterica subsp. enterica serovar Paratyphi B str. ATCC 19940]|nr:isoaspartyl dipeptidase [Salmonella enterica subsp. enterica serovar Paratyphi B str. ATCC 19940]ESG00875.1 isoaspartyl dipeptidase [Salmonella enterica subsp. enterica serovar Paratyphi B str. ATCC 10719]